MLSLCERLEADAFYFDEKLSFIPTRNYLAGESDQNAFEKKGKKSKDKKKKKKNKASALNKFRVDQKTLPQKIDTGSLGTGIETDVKHQLVAVKKRSVGEESVAAAAAASVPTLSVSTSVVGPSKVMNAQMSEIAEKLGFVPGSQAKSPAELKQRMALLRDWYKSKNARPENEEMSEKKQKRKLEKQKRKEKLKSKKSSKKKKEEAAAGEEEQDEEEKKKNEEEKESGKDETKQSDALDFGVFKFSSGRPEPLFRERKRGRDQDVLKKLEAEKAKMEELAKTPEGAQIVKEKEWEKMMLRAEGEKVKDDPALLKKSIKKKEKKKQKSQADWAAKAKKQEEAKQAKQADYLKRQEKNILRKKHGRKQVGASAVATTRKQRAGFEGKITKKTPK